MQAAKAGLAQAPAIYRRGTQHHLFAKTPAEKQRILAELVTQSAALHATPKLVVYDRGASLGAVAPKLRQAGVQKVGIPPRGPGAWLVGKKDQPVVKSERGKTEGSIGRLKSRKYGFRHRQERCGETQEATGQRAIVSVNLNTLMGGIVEGAGITIEEFRKLL